VQARPAANKAREINHKKEETAMLIFDQFPAREKAEQFAEQVKRQFQIGATVYDSQDESNVVDVFPFKLWPPIVLVDRRDGETADESVALEDEVRSLVVDFSGEFAGT
jgi:hypothetical protein